MIKANELMIGNIVLNQGKPFRISGIAEENRMEGFEGIPLTPDVLAKCGFVKGPRQSGGYCGYSNGVIKLDDHCTFGLYDGRMDDAGTKFYGPPLDYLHHLQNLFFALTGEELKIINYA